MIAMPRFGSHTSWKMTEAPILRPSSMPAAKPVIVAKRRTDQHRVVGVEAEASGERDVAGQQRIEAMHDAFGRAGGARREHQHRHLIGGKRADLADRGGPRRSLPR